MDSCKLQEYDFLFPVVTQAITTYVDIFTKQRYLYMSYTKHKIAKASQLKEAAEQEHEAEMSFTTNINLQNLD